MSARGIAAAPIRLYQRVLSPALPQRCKYHPSCSAYALEAVRVHGSVRGSWLAARRVVRCHPWAAGGVDHVPPPRTRVAHPTHHQGA